MYELIVYGVLYALWFGVVIYRTRIAVLLLPIFFPFYLLRIDVSGIPIYFVEGLIVLAAIPVFYKILKGEHHEILSKDIPEKIKFFFKNLFGKKEKPFVDFLKSPFLPISLFLIACLISATIVPGESFKQALGILKSWIIVPLIFFVIFYKTVKSKRDISFAMKAYVASVIVLALWALYQALSGQYVTIDDRVSGPFESANYLALYMSPALIFVSVRFIQTFLHRRFETADKMWNDVERRVYVAPIVALLFAVLVLTQSYGGVIGVFGALFIYIIYERSIMPKGIGRTFLNKLIVFIVLIFVAGSALTVALNSEKFTNLTKLDEQTSIATRVEIWSVGTHLIKENPLLGIGLGQYEANYVERAEEILGKKPYEEKRLHSHNIFLEFWLNSGLLGLISFIWIVVLAYMQILKPLSRSDKHIQIAGLVILTYIMLHGLIDVPFWKNDLALLFWLVVGSIFAQTKLPRS
ncbi:O-antigen ligase family protein [Patescibacteria group bacterium]